MNLGGSSSNVAMAPTRSFSRLGRPSSDSIRKVAVTMHGRAAQFLELDQSRPLVAIMHDICKEWQLSETENYALQFTDANRQTYITEKNRNEIQTGNVLKLTSSPAKTSQEIYDKLKDNKKENKADALKQLPNLSVDSSFAQEFISKQGLHLIIDIVINRQEYTIPLLAFALKSFVSLMDHSIVSWDIVDENFIKKVAECLQDEDCLKEVTCLQAALEIIECVLLHSDKYTIVEQAFTPSELIGLIKNNSVEVPKNVIAVLNAMLMKADREKHKQMAENLQSKSFRNIIIDHIILKSKTIDTDMAHQLSVLQQIMLNLNEERMNSPPDPTKNANDITELQKIAFDFEGEASSRKTITVSRDFTKDTSKDAKKLGFTNIANPLEDFQQTPPGVLALDCMLYFARFHSDNYVKVVLENCSRADEHDCPFAQASIYLAKILCEILKIGEPPSEECSTYHRIFFSHDRPFEEFFSTCIQLWNKTWKEMRATTLDFQKVLSVVREQIIRGLNDKPLNFDDFRDLLKQFTYAEILKNWEKERQSKEAWESNAQPIIELRKQVTPNIIEMIKKQRMNFMMAGTLFSKIRARGIKKDKWFWRLSTNMKTFHYGDWNSESTPTIEQLPNKLSVVDVKSLVVDKECPHVKEGTRRKNIVVNLSFSMIPVTCDPQNFVASSQHEFDMWTDGINTLLGNPMGSKQMKEDLEMLLGMEIKLLLLDTEGIPIPSVPPPIPSEPDNLDFFYKI